MYKFVILIIDFVFFSFPPTQNPFIKIPYNLISKISHFGRRILKISALSSAIFSYIFSLSKSHPFPRGTSLNVLQLYLFSRSREVPLSLSFSLLQKKNGAIAETNKSIKRRASHVSKVRRCEGKCEESRREEPRPVKFPGEVISRLRWPVNMGKRRYSRSYPERIL